MRQLKLLSSSLLSLTASIAFSQNKYEADFLEFWSDYNENYAYMSEQHIDWNKVKEIYLPEARQIQADYEFVHLLERVTHELHNGHITLNMSYDTSNRIIPSGADIFVEKSGSKFFITDVKENSKAAACGLKAGTEVVKFGNKPVEGQLANFLPRYAVTYDASMYSYAVNMLFAGVHNTGREITYYPDSEKTEASKTLLEVKILEKNIGYIRINNSLGNYDVIAAFDEALDELKNTKAIILDLTDTPSGGNTTIARAIMGRFIEMSRPEKS
jgi:carboxyl-terminal processing protease